MIDFQVREAPTPFAKAKRDRGRPGRGPPSSRPPPAQGSSVTRNFLPLMRPSMRLFSAAALTSRDTAT